MRISKLEKEVLFEKGEVRLSVEILVSRGELTSLKYDGFDMLPDEAIPDILLAISRRYARRIGRGRINQEKAGSILP